MICPKCNQPGEFSKNKARPSGLQSYCKACFGEYRKAWYAKKTEEIGEFVYKAQQREYNLKIKYGLKPEEVPDRCQVCTSDLRVCVDHDHNTGMVRGFLCDRCNVVLGRVKDDPKLLRQLAEYLEKI